MEKYKGEMGCCASFTGFVRNYDLKEGKKISTDGMSIRIDNLESILYEIRKNALKKFDILDVVIYHNSGDLKIGDIISSYYVFSKHRQEAFLAVEYIIYELKKYH
jgi:molybdopterin synthase catalytic subunit